MGVLGVAWGLRVFLVVVFCLTLGMIWHVSADLRDVGRPCRVVASDHRSNTRYPFMGESKTCVTLVSAFCNVSYLRRFCSNHFSRRGR